MARTNFECPHCGSERNRGLKTYRQKGAQFSTLRVYRCLDCGNNFDVVGTYEVTPSETQVRNFRNTESPAK
ncbi:hypothetical protein KDL45_14960 [bacterium]|nr:hypothetical protein [bacterium]